MVQPLSILRYRGMMSKQMHQSPVVSLFRKNKKVEKVISGGSSVGGGVGDGLSGSVSHNQVSNGNDVGGKASYFEEDAQIHVTIY